MSEELEYATFAAPAQERPAETWIKVFRESALVHRPGIWDAILAFESDPLLLAVYVAGGVLAPQELSRFIAESNRGWDLFERFDRGTSNPRAMAGPEWLMKFLSYFQGYRPAEENTQEIWLPVTEIHRPQLDGCAAKFALSSSRKDGATFKLSLPGFSGGGGCSKTVECIREGTVEGNPIRIEVNATARFTRYRRQSDHDEIVAVSIAKISEEFRDVVIDPPNIEIGIDTLKTRFGAKVQNPADGEPAYTVIVEDGWTHKFSLGGEIESKPLGKYSAALSIESEILEQARITYEMKAGSRFAFWQAQPGSHVILTKFE